MKETYHSNVEDMDINLYISIILSFGSSFVYSIMTGSLTITPPPGAFRLIQSSFVYSITMMKVLFKSY